MDMFWNRVERWGPAEVNGIAGVKHEADDSAAVTLTYAHEV